MNLVIRRAKMEDDMFLLFNSTPSTSSDFEELYAVRTDLASLLKSICQSCGSMTIYRLLNQNLTQVMAKAATQTQPSEILETYLDIECLLFCFATQVKSINEEEFGQIQDVITLVK